jgi:CO/xanthine dehydrogenase FAD-binding subunit
MITNYFRPYSLEDALTLLAATGQEIRPLGGGTWLDQRHDEQFSVVDLQAIGLNNLRKTGNNLEIEACVTLQQLFESIHTPEALRQAMRVDSSLNIRNVATVAGTLVTCDGRSAFATCMLALDAKLNIQQKHAQAPGSVGLGEFLALRPAGLITSIEIAINAKSAFETLARSPMDKPIVCAAMTLWPSGRIRLALGGTGKSPFLAMDGAEVEANPVGGVESAARNALHETSDDWASAEFRTNVAAILAKRCLDKVTGTSS